MIKTCQHCGAVNGDATEVCCFCDAPLGESKRAPVSRRLATPTEGNLAVEPEWRREVSSRLQEYRARRRGGAAGELQAALPFEPPSASPIEASNATKEFTPEFARPLQEARPLGARKLRSERFEISIPKQEKAPAAVPAHGPYYLQPAAGSEQATLLPVASLPERRRSALVDGAFLLFTYGGMLALFTAMGGHIGMNKLDLTVAGATFALFYAQYFALFTVFGGATPGMMLRGLRVVSFDGSIPSSRQMIWRSFGYMISAGACFLGFLWALWDEDHLCWHDRISQSYLTPIEVITRY